MAKEKILIVEDERDIIEMIEYNLAREGYATLAVSSGKDAVSRAKRKTRI